MARKVNRACECRKKILKLCTLGRFSAISDLSICREFLLAPWIFIVTFVFLALLLALALYLLARQRKRQEQELRLVSGRRKLIGQEIDIYLEELESLDQNEITALRQHAETALDQIHIALVERQVHLLNYEDMAHLQKCKMDLLADRSPPPLQAPAEDRADLPPPKHLHHLQHKIRPRLAIDLFWKANYAIE